MVDVKPPQRRNHLYQGSIIQPASCVCFALQEAEQAEIKARKRKSAAEQARLENIAHKEAKQQVCMTKESFLMFLEPCYWLSASSFTPPKQALARGCLLPERLPLLLLTLLAHLLPALHPHPLDHGIHFASLTLCSLCASAGLLFSLFVCPPYIPALHSRSAFSPYIPPLQPALHSRPTFHPAGLDETEGRR